MSIVYIVATIFFVLFFPIKLNIYGYFDCFNTSGFSIFIYNLKLFGFLTKVIKNKLTLITRKGKNIPINLSKIFNSKFGLKKVNDFYIKKIILYLNCGKPYIDKLIYILCILNGISYPVGVLINKKLSNFNYGLNVFIANNNELNLSISFAMYFNLISILSSIFYIVKERFYNEK